MRPKTRRKVRFVLWTSLVSATASLVVGAFVLGAAGQPQLLNLLKAVLVGATMGGAAPAADVFLLTRALRRQRFALAIAVKALALTALALVIYVALSFLLSPWLPWAPDPRELVAVAATNLAVCFIYSSVVGVNRLLGRRVLASFITGRYFRPVEETRIFMFLDLTGSTSIAEKIGNEKFHHLLHEFFCDVADAVFDSDGEIYKYVGDEVIVTWRLEDGLKHANCLRCYWGICDAIDGAQAKYERQFGLVPRFAAGLHFGPVMVGQMGDERAEIAFLGDVVNTTARVQAECKTRGEPLLLSDELRERLPPLPELTWREVGRVKLRGKEEEIGLCAVSR